MALRALPTPAELHEAFLWSAVRVVTKTAQVSLYGNSFEVDAALVGRRVELVFNPLRGTSDKGSNTSSTGSPTSAASTS